MNAGSDMETLVNLIEGSGVTYTWGATSILKLMDYAYAGGSIDVGSGMCPLIVQVKYDTLAAKKKVYWNCPVGLQKYSIDTLYASRTNIGDEANNIVGIGTSRDFATFAQTADTSFVMV